MNAAGQAELQDISYVERRYGLSRAQAYEACRLGIIPHIRIGRRIRIDPERLREWEEAGGSTMAGREAA